MDAMDIGRMAGGRLDATRVVFLILDGPMVKSPELGFCFLTAFLAVGTFRVELYFRVIWMLLPILSFRRYRH